MTRGARLGHEGRADAGDVARLVGFLEEGEPVTALVDNAGGAIGLDSVADGDPADWEVERAGVRLADVGGMTEVKNRLEASFLAPMRNPELRRLYGKRRPAPIRSARNGEDLHRPRHRRRDGCRVLVGDAH